ncbi:MAG TPA: hypothetical protein VF337_03560 [Candidatus Limnocylindrales bacterium]
MEQRRRVAFGMGGAAFALIAIGIAALVFDAGVPGVGSATPAATATGTPGSNSPAVVASPTVQITGPIGSGNSAPPRPSGSASPKASDGTSQHPAGFVQTGDVLAYRTADGSLIPVQAVPGLEVQVDRGRAIYVALPSNRYGLRSGDYAGEFMPLVTMGQADGSTAETGGIVLTSRVVSTLTADRLASIQSDSDRWVVALPVDIRTAGKTNVDVAFDQFGLAGWNNTPRVVVRFGGSLPIVETNPSNGGFHVLVEQLGVTSWQVIDPIRLSLPAGLIDPNHAMNQLLIYGSGTPSVQRDVTYDGRASVGQLMLSAGTDVCVSLVVAGSRAELGPDKVLTVNGVPVFAAVN